MFELEVIKKFNGKVEGKLLSPGNKITTDDLERVNALVGRGYCVIKAVQVPEEKKGAKDGKKE